VYVSSLVTHSSWMPQEENYSFIVVLQNDLSLKTETSKSKRN